VACDLLCIRSQTQSAQDGQGCITFGVAPISPSPNFTSVACPVLRRSIPVRPPCSEAGSPVSAPRYVPAPGAACGPVLVHLPRGYPNQFGQASVVFLYPWSNLLRRARRKTDGAAGLLQTPAGKALFPPSNAFVTCKNCWVPRWTQLSGSQFSHCQDELPVDLILPIHAKRESLLPIGSGRAECAQSTVANYRAATSFTGQLSRPVYRVFIASWP
jgi:hypothetical protein